MTEENGNTGDAEASGQVQNGSSGTGTSTKSDYKGMLKAVTEMVGAYTTFGPKGIEKKDATDRFYLVSAMGFIVGMVLSLVAFILYELEIPVPVIAAVTILMLFLIMKYAPFCDLTDYGNGLSSDAKGNLVGFGLSLAIFLVVFASLFSLDMMMLSIIWPLEIVTKNAMVSTVRYAKTGDETTANLVGKIDQGAMVMSMVTSIVLSLIALIIIGLVYLCVTYENIFSNGSMVLNVIVAVLVATVISWVIGWLVANRANSRSEAIGESALMAANEISRAAILVVFILLSGGVLI
jgi:hypothetical protein